MERLRGNRSLATALTGITAAVVGVIANLALWFAVHTLFAGSRTVSSGPVRLTLPDTGTLRWVPLGIAVLAALAMFRLRWSIPHVLAACAGLGLLAAAVGLPVG